MMTAASHNEHSSSQHFLLVLRLEMQLLCKQNVPYAPGCMLSKQSRTKPAERRKSSAFGHETLLISYHRINFIENVTIECIDGNWMRGVPLRCPYLYTIKKNKSVS